MKAGQIMSAKILSVLRKWRAAYTSKSIVIKTENPIAAQLKLELFIPLSKATRYPSMIPVKGLSLKIHWYFCGIMLTG